MSDNITDIFVDDMYNLAQTDYSVKVIKQAKMCLLDYLGVTFAGARMLEKKGNKLLNYFGSTLGEASIIGFNKKTNMQNAALLNGLSAHIAELDDGERRGMLHPGATIISALLPLAECEKIGGDDLLRGIIVGYEAAIRIAGALQPSMKDRGYHGTGTCGVIGASIGIAAALNFSKEQIKDALSAAATSASGILKAIKDTSELKPYNAGQAAQNGLTSAFFARAGFRGPDDVLSGDLGFISIMAAQCNLSRLSKTKGDLLSIQKIYMKPYAACRHSHPAIEAALNIRSKHGVRPEDIKEIKVSTYRWAVGGHDHVKIQGVASAKMSTPYSVAVALETGKAGIEEFTPEHIENSITMALAQKVQVCAVDELTALIPAKRAAIVEITVNDNKNYVERVDLAKGEPENPLSENEIKDKFFALALYSNKSKKAANDIIQHVLNLESDLDKLYFLL